jgi:flagellar assembly factor FliW
MRIHTTRFGGVEIELDDILSFPVGILGLEDCRKWVLLADAQNSALAWLQCISRADVALAVVSPRRFVPGYQLRVRRESLELLKLESLADIRVLTIVGRTEHSVTLNLKAPIVLNLSRRLGGQLVDLCDQPLQYEVVSRTVPFRKTA